MRQSQCYKIGSRLLANFPPLPHLLTSQETEGNGSTGLGIGKGMMMMPQIVATGSSYGLQLVVGQRAAQLAARGSQRIVEKIIWIVHLVDPEHSFQASLVEAGIMCHERGPQQFLCRPAWGTRNRILRRCRPIREEHISHSLPQQLPHTGEDRRIVSILLAQPMHALKEIAVVVGLRLDKAVERVCHLGVAHQDSPY